jgi:RHS repeat-associated protein
MPRVTVGHPVDVVSGAVYTAWHDFEFSGELPLIWRRFYNSSIGSKLGPAGRGWMTPYLIHLEDRSEDILFINDEGQEVSLAPPSDGRPTVDAAHELELYPDGDQLLLYYWHHKERYRFDRDPHALGRWRLNSIRNLADNGVEVRYDSSGRLSELRQSPGRVLRATYDEDGMLSGWSFGGGGRSGQELVRYKYDEERRLTNVRFPNGSELRYQYDPQHRLICETNQVGASFHFDYDVEGRCTHCWGDGGYLERRIAYNAIARQSVVIDSRGYHTTYLYDSGGRVIRQVDPLGAIRFTIYDELGRPTSEVDEDGGETKLEYDEAGNLRKETDPSGHAFSYEYDERHLRIGMKDGVGNEWRWRFDKGGHPQALEGPGGARYFLEWSADGFLTRTLAPNGHEIQRRRPADWAWSEMEDEFGLINRYEYDELGRVVAVFDASGLRQTLSYDDGVLDERGRVRGIREADGANSYYRYDAAGNLVEEVDTEGKVVGYLYTPFGKLHKVLHPDGTTVRCEWDTEGRLVALTDERGEQATFRYDPIGRLSHQTFLDGRTEEYEYDPAGNLIAVTRSDDCIEHMEYDKLGRCTSRKFPSGEEFRFSYDERGRIISAENSATRLEFAYDAWGQLVREAQDDHVVEYGYDPVGNLSLLHYKNGAVGPLKLYYDGRSRLSKIEVGEVTLERHEHDECNRIHRRIVGNGVWAEEFEYDARHRLREQTVWRGRQVLVRRNYRFDAADRLVDLREERAERRGFVYDSRSRLMEVSGESGPTEVFTYDPTGNVCLDGTNRLVTDRGNRVSQTGPELFEYDQRGRTIKWRSARRSLKLGYDDADQLAFVEDESGQRRAEYAYDPLGRRIRKTQEGVDTRFIWAGQVLLAERGKEGSVREYLVGYASHRPLIQWVDGRPYGIVTDFLGTARELVDLNGTVVWRARYNAWGALEEESGREQSCSFRLPGQYHDRESDLYYNHLRYYVPRAARFLSPDPIGFLGGTNVYRYVPDPVNWIDPLGLKCGRRLGRAEGPRPGDPPGGRRSRSFEME